MTRVRTRQENLWVQIDPKPCTKYAQFHRQSNCQSSASLETTQSRNKYFLQFTSLANFSTNLSQCCQMFIPSIYQYQNLSEQINTNDTEIKGFNKIFEYACLIYFLQCKLMKEEQKGISYQQLESFNQYKQFFDCDKIKQLKLATGDFHQKFQQMLSQSIIKVRNLLIKQQIETYNSQQQHGKLIKRKKKKQQHIFPIPIIEKVLQKVQSQTINQIMQIRKDNARRLNYLPKHLLYRSTDEQIEIYIKKILNELFWTQFVMKELKIKKFKHCVRQDYRDYLKASFATLKEATRRLEPSYNLSIMIKRYTSNKRDEVLITMKDLVQLRKDLAYQQQSSKPGQAKEPLSYKKEYFEITKKIVSELTLHNKLTRNYYPLLSPSSIIFNQLSLKINLDYQNVIYEGLGLLMRPKSIEHSICFSPTPQPFDTFTSPVQLDSENKLKMYHFLYGLDKYQPTQLQKLQPGNRASYDKQSLMKQSQCWRCLQSISYIMNNGRQYLGFNVINRNKFDNFIKLVTLAQQKLQGKKWFQVLGKDFIQMIKKQRVSDIPQHYDFQKGTSFLDSLLYTEDNDYSIVENNQFNNIIKRFNMQLQLCKEIIKILEDKTYFETISNSVKYLTRFYLNLYFHFTHILSLCRYYKNRQFAKGIILQRELSQKLSLFKERKQGYIEQSQKKFREYEDRNKVTPVIHLQQTINNFNQQYNQLYYLFDIYQKISKNLIELDIDKSHQDKKQMQNFYQVQIQKLGNEVAKYLPQIKDYCRNIIEKEFMKQLRKKQQIIENQKTTQKNISIQLNIKHTMLNIQVKATMFLLTQDKFENNFEHIYAIVESALTTDEKTSINEKDRQKIGQSISILEYLQDILRNIQSKNVAL